MALRLSTAYRNIILRGRSIQDAFQGNTFLYIFSGTQPATADDAVPSDSTQLVTIQAFQSTNIKPAFPLPLRFGPPVDGTIGMEPGRIWCNPAESSGVAGWFRLGYSSLILGESKIHPRMDGAIGERSGEMQISDINITMGELVQVSTFNITLPSG